MQGYCMKCRETREMVDTEDHTMKNGRPAVKGKCGTCGCGMFKIVSKKDS